MNMLILLAWDYCHDKHQISVKWAVVWDLTDTQGKLTNLTTWWTIVHYQIPSNWTRKPFFKLWNLPSSTVLSFMPQETWRMPHAQTTRQETQPHPSVNWKDLTQDTENTDLWKGRELGPVCSTLNKETRMKFRCPEWNVLHASPCFEV